MIWFPQIGLGSVSQYPLRRTRTWRKIENRLEGGETISLPDAAASRIEWQMRWQELNDSEAGNIKDHFASVQGSWQSFGLVDPLANLLAWSEDLTQPDWQAGQLSLAGSAVDPFGLQGAWTITNAAAGQQSLTQSIGIPGSYMACFSLWLRSDSPETVSLARGGSAFECGVERAWKRAYVSASGTGTSADFGITLEAGATIQAFGFQLEAQPYPSQYKSSRVARGIYPETRYASDELALTATAQGLTACDIALVSRI